MRKAKHELSLNFFIIITLLFLPFFSYAQESNSIKNEEFSSSSVSLFIRNKDKNDKYILSLKKKEPIEWKKNTFKTDTATSLRITDLNSGLWSLLPSSEFEISDSKQQIEENPFKRSGELKSGIMRIKASGEGNSSNKTDRKNNITVTTNEITVFVPRGGDVVISRFKDASQSKYSTQVYSLNGTVFLKVNAALIANKNKALGNEIPIGPGQLFSVSQNGNIAPLVAPNELEVQQVMAYTTTQEEKLAKLHYSDGIELSDLIEQCAQLEKSNSYFEILNLFEAYKNDFKNNAKVPYCLGIASEGLNQKKEAIRYFKFSALFNPKDIDSHWHLGQLYLQEKNYSLARIEFETAYRGMSSTDKRYKEFNYYIAVIDFFEQKYRNARDAFVRCSWDDELDAALKQSSIEFISQIRVDKPWSFIIPLGITYDSNVLSLSRNESLPSTYSSKASWKTYFGSIFNYDTSLESTQNGWFLGGEAKAFYVRNLNTTYSSLNALVLEGTLYETKRYKQNDSQDSFKLYQTNGLTYIGDLRDTYYLLAGIKYKQFDFNLGSEFDISQRESGQKKTDFLANQYYADSYGNVGIFLFSLNSQLQEKMTKNKTDTLGNSLEIIGSPSFLYPISQRTNVSFTQTMDFTWTQATSNLSTYKFLPALTGNYFITRWILSSLTGIYEVDVNNPGSSVVYKPQMTFSLTGML